MIATCIIFYRRKSCGKHVSEGYYFVMQAVRGDSIIPPMGVCRLASKRDTAHYFCACNVTTSVTRLLQWQLAPRDAVYTVWSLEWQLTSHWEYSSDPIKYMAGPEKVWWIYMYSTFAMGSEIDFEVETGRNSVSVSVRAPKLAIF